MRKKRTEGLIPRRCLGPLAPAHDFLSDGPGNRVCPKCAATIERIHLSVQYDRPTPVLSSGVARAPY